MDCTVSSSTKQKKKGNRSGFKIKQYSSCTLCRLSHRQGRKHVYGRTHQNIAKRIISKFAKKVKGCKASFTQPVFSKYDNKQRATIWCCFCTEQVSCHEGFLEALCCVQYATFFQHLASEKHKENVDKFIMSNRLEIEDKVKGRLTVDGKRCSEFMERAKIAVDHYRESQKRKLENAVRQYQETCIHRERVLQSSKFLPVSSSRTGTYALNNLSGGNRMSGPHQQNSAGFRTVSAKGEGLTCIKIVPPDPRIGNVHTTAMPPWLVEEEPTSSASSVEPQDIGPDMDIYQQHLANERKRKLPDCRVGARRREEIATADWLPSFGHVWSSAVRSRQRKLTGMLSHNTRAEYSNSTANRTHTITSSYAPEMEVCEDNLTSIDRLRDSEEMWKIKSNFHTSKSSISAGSSQVINDNDQSGDMWRGLTSKFRIPTESDTSLSSSNIHIHTSGDRHNVTAYTSGLSTTDKTMGSINLPHENSSQRHQSSLRGAYVRKTYSSSAPVVGQIKVATNLL